MKILTHHGTLSYLRASISRCMLLVVALMAVGGEAWALGYPEGRFDADLYRRGANYVVRSESGGSEVYQFERRPNQNQDIGRLVAQTTYVVPSDGRYRFTTGVKNGDAHLSVWGVGNVNQVSSGGAGSNDIVYSNPSYEGDYRAGTRVQLGFHASFGGGSDYAFAKVTVRRVGDLPPATPPGGGSGGGSPGGGSPGNQAPAAAVNTGFVWGEVAQSDFGQDRYHTKTWTPSGAFLGTVYGDANLSRTSNQNSNVGIVGWRRLLVPPSAGTYTLSANASNAQIWLRINGQSVAMPYTLTVALGQQFKIDCVASFGAGWNASAGLVVGWQASSPGGGSGGGSPGGGSSGNQAPAAAVNSGFVWGEKAESDFGQDRYHTKTWTPSGAFLGTVYGDANLSRTSNQNSNVGIVGWRRLLVAPAAGTYTLSANASNAQIWLRINGQSVAMPYTTTVAQGQQIKIDCVASFGAGWNASAGLTVGWQASVPPANTPPSAAFDSGFVWGQVAQSDYVQDNYHTKTWTPSGTFIGSAYGFASLSRTSNQNSNVGIVGWRRLLVAPAAGTYTLSANASNAQIWLRINGQGVAMPYRLTVAQGQQVKIDCVASFGAGWNASAGLTVGWQANTSPSAAVDAGFVWGQVAQSDYIQNNYHTKTWTPSGTFIETVNGDASLSRTSSQNSNVGIVGWRRLLVAPAAGTYSFSANASNAQVWLRINGQGVTMPHTITVTQGQQVKIDCVAWFGSGWNASAAFSFSWQNSGSDGNPLADLDKETCDAIGAALITAISEHQPENEDENIQPFELPQVYIDSRESAISGWPWTGSIEANLGEKLLTPDSLKIFRITANAKIKGDLTGSGPRPLTIQTTVDRTPFDLRGTIGAEVGLKGTLNWPGVVNFDKVVYRKRIAPYRNREYRIGSKITITTELSGVIYGSGSLAYKGPRNDGTLTSRIINVQGKGKVDVKGTMAPGFLEVRDVNLITGAVIPNSTHRVDLIKVSIGGFVGPTIGGSFGFSQKWGNLRNSDVHFGFNAFTLEWGGEITFTIGKFNYKYTPTWRKEFWKGTGKKVIWSTDLRQGAGTSFKPSPVR